MTAYANSTDPHTDYLGPRAAENFDIAMKLSLEGIGAVLQARDDYTRSLSWFRPVRPSSPASCMWATASSASVRAIAARSSTWSAGAWTTWST
jgi:hypothetical protein